MATLSSTSYDDAAQEPRHPDWQGGSWYGTSSGTYWTINPREYADPRKHGAEYQARARRAARPSEARSDGRARDAGPVRDAGPAEDGGLASGTRPNEDASAPPESQPGSPRQAEPVYRTPTERSQRPASMPGGRSRTAGSSSAGLSVADTGAAGSSGIAIAGSIGLASGAVAAIPAGIVFLGSIMGGDSSLAALALTVPPAVAVAVGLAVGALRHVRR